MIITVLVFILILSVLVMIHELGHFTMARIIGVRVEEFGLGLPPRIFGKKVKDTIYSLNSLPIGGFVKLAGEDDDEMKVKDKKKIKEFFWGRSKTERSLILVAGVTMNFILAVVITAGLLVDGVKEPSGHVKIESVSSGSPAFLAGLQAGDIISSIRLTTNSQASAKLIKVPGDLISQTKTYAGTPIRMEVIRNGATQTLDLTPRKNPPKGEGAIGVAITDLETKKYSLIQAPYMAVKVNLERAWEMLAGTVQTVWGLLTNTGSGAADIAGPIGIAQVTGQAVKFGWKAVLEFMSILSLNLAVINILPIPALDGGRLAFIFIEKILGRRVKPAFEKQTHQIGMIILLILILLVSINDIMRLSRGG